MSFLLLALYIVSYFLGISAVFLYGKCSPFLPILPVTGCSLSISFFSASVGLVTDVRFGIGLGILEVLADGGLGAVVWFFLAKKVATGSYVEDSSFSTKTIFFFIPDIIIQILFEQLIAYESY